LRESPTCVPHSRARHSAAQSILNETIDSVVHPSSSPARPVCPRLQHKNALSTGGDPRIVGGRLENAVRNVKQVDPPWLNAAPDSMSANTPWSRQLEEAGGPLFMSGWGSQNSCQEHAGRPAANASLHRRSTCIWPGNYNPPNPRGLPGREGLVLLLRREPETEGNRRGIFVGRVTRRCGGSGHKPTRGVGGVCHARISTNFFQPSESRDLPSFFRCKAHPSPPSDLAARRFGSSLIARAKRRMRSATPPGIVQAEFVGPSAR